MPFSMRPLNDGKGLLVKGFGHVSDQEYRDFVQNALVPQTDDTVSHKFCFHDYTDVESVGVHSETISETGRRAAKLFENNPGMLMAVAAPSDLVYGLANMWSVWADNEDTQTRLFRDSEKAREWLRAEVFGSQAVA
ncbi:MAG: hypothetical protein AAF660_15805 [Pseudomonadota bacterium]